MTRQIFTIIILSLIFVFTAIASPVSAQTLKFSQVNPSQPVCAGSNFQVQILINTNNQQTINSDALMTFDPAKLSINSAVSGNFYTYFSSNPLGGVNTKYLVSSWEESIARSKTSSVDTLYATLNLSAKTAGTASLAFDCTANTDSDSNINRASDSKDIIVCPLQPLNVTVLASGCGVTTTPAPTTPPVPTTTTGPAATSTPIPTPTPTRTPTPTPIPAVPTPGSTQLVLFGLGLGAILTVAGLMFIL